MFESSCFCFRPFIRLAGGLILKRAYTQGLVVERGLEFRESVGRDVGAQTHRPGGIIEALERDLI